MRTAIAVIAAVLAPLLLPAAFAFAVVCVASVIVPPVGLLAGVLADTLYYVPSIGLPYATAIGAVISILGYAVHRFIETRIMSA